MPGEPRTIDESMDRSAALYAGIVAGILATLVQIVLWATFTNALPEVLFRDARLTAAIVMGRGVLPPPATFDARVMLAATLLHFALSIAYAFALARLISGLRGPSALLAGAVFGACLYVLNMYGFTNIFPWFEVTRDWITVAAHVAFGVGAAGAYRVLALRKTARA